MRWYFFNWESIVTAYHLQSRQKLLNHYSDVFISNFSAPICNGKDSTLKCNIVSGDEKMEFHFETRVLDTVTISSLNQKETTWISASRWTNEDNNNNKRGGLKTFGPDCGFILLQSLICLFAMHFVHVTYSHFSLFFIYLYLYKQLHYYFVNIHIYIHPLHKDINTNLSLML